MTSRDTGGAPGIRPGAPPAYATTESGIDMTFRKDGKEGNMTSREQTIAQVTAALKGAAAPVAIHSAR